MAAIKGVKKSSVVKKQKGKVGVWVPILSSVISMIVVAGGFLIFWNYYYQDVHRDVIINELESGKYHAYHAIRDITSGEYIAGAVELVAVPTNLSTSDMLVSSDDISNLKASGDITANSLMTERNTFDPQLQNPVQDKTRIYPISYINTDKVEVGDFIDIRFKKSKAKIPGSYEDKIVVAKVEVLSKDEDGVIELQLTEEDILNVNSAVIESATAGIDGELYIGKYLDPANQPLPAVDYSRKDINYTAEELAAAQEKLMKEQEKQDSKNASTENTGNSENGYSGVEVEPAG